MALITTRVSGLIDRRPEGASPGDETRVESTARIVGEKEQEQHSRVRRCGKKTSDVVDTGKRATPGQRQEETGMVWPALRLCSTRSKVDGWRREQTAAQRKSTRRKAPAEPEPAPRRKRTNVSLVLVGRGEKGISDHPILLPRLLATQLRPFAMMRSNLPFFIISTTRCCCCYSALLLQKRADEQHSRGGPSSEIHVRHTNCLQHHLLSNNRHHRTQTFPLYEPLPTQHRVSPSYFTASTCRPEDREVASLHALREATRTSCRYLTVVVVYSCISPIIPA